MNVILVEDQRLFREGFKSLLGRFEGVKVLGEAGNGLEMFELLSSLSTQPDVIFLDLRMPVMDGEEALLKLKKEYPQIKVIILSAFYSESLILNSLKYGANAYLSKNAEPEEILLALEVLKTSDLYLSIEDSKVLVKEARREGVKDEQSDQLNTNELYVLKSILSRKENYHMASELNLSVRTIEGIKSKLLRKTKAKSTLDLVLIAVKDFEYWGLFSIFKK
jgi:DNA-binding NarL/FixJ family response regulator